MKTVVVDSSVVVKWVNEKDEKDLLKAWQILKEIQQGKLSVLAPELARYEVGNALLNKKLTLDELLDAMDVLYGVPVEFFPETLKLATEASKIAQTLRITYYDASFVALAKLEDVVLVTANPKHQKKFERVKVVALEDYK